MRKFRVAIGQNDDQKIANGHLGDAEYFYIYDVYEDGRVKFIERRKNTSPKEERGKHGLDEKRRAVLKILSDVDVMVSKLMSPNFLKIAESERIQPVIVRGELIEEVHKKLSEAFDEIYELLERRKRGERFREIPKL